MFISLSLHYEPMVNDAFAGSRKEGVLLMVQVRMVGTSTQHLMQLRCFGKRLYSDVVNTMSSSVAAVGLAISVAYHHCS